MSTAIQEYLRDGGTLEELKEKFGISAKRHARYPNLVLLKYNQIASPFEEQMVRECRGIVLDQDDGWRVVSRAFDKFFNHGEALASQIDWNTAAVQEKIDGSLSVIYAYDGMWQVATSGTPDASGDVHGNGKTFNDYFWETFDANTDELPALDCGMCFYFELTGPLNRIVVPHAEASVTLLGARDLRTQLEIPVRLAERLFLPGVATVKQYDLSDLDAIHKTFDSISPLEQEGYVVVDERFRRIKIKHPKYVELHHAKDGLSRKAFVNIARRGESCEVIAHFPEFKPLLDEAQGKVDQLRSFIEASWELHKGVPDQKSFAMAVKDAPWSSALFTMRKTGQTAAEFLRDCRLEWVLERLGIQDDQQEAA